MFDRKRIIALAIVAALIVATVLVAVLWPKSAPVEGSHAGPTPSAPAPTADTDTSLPPELETVAYTAIAAAANFQGSDSEAERQRAYAAAGFTDELAGNFTPLWFEVFDSPSVGSVTIAVTGETLLSASVSAQVRSVNVEDVTGPVGQRVYRVWADVDCQPQWTATTGNPQMPTKFTASWSATIREADGAVTYIEQPAPDELPFQLEN